MWKRIAVFGVLVATMALLVTISACDKGDGQPNKPGGKGSGKFCVSLGWMENESGQRQRRGFEDGFRDFGGEAVFSDANYDAKKQSEQIDAFIETKPRAIFVTPSDPAGITEACRRVVNAGIPLFVADAIIAGVPAKLSICSSDFRMGVWTMEYIARKLGGQGRIAMIDLPENEAWDLRGQGARAALENYPDIKLVQVHHHNSQAIEPRKAVENMLTTYPKGKLDAIWCAWDGAAQEGALAIKDADRAGEIFTTGIDGGKHAFEVIKSGGPFKLTMAQSIYYMSYKCVQYAHKHLKGERVPRFINSPVYAVQKKDLDALPAELKPEEYDVPGMAIKFGWNPVL